MSVTCYVIVEIVEYWLLCMVTVFSYSRTFHRDMYTGLCGGGSEGGGGVTS